jgi:hypothetical protein
MTVQIEKAPATSGNSGEGIDQSIREEMTLNNSPTPSAIIPRRSCATVLSVKPPTPTEVDWATQFTNFNVRVNYCKETRVFTEDVMGTLFRFAGDIAVRPDHEEILVNVFVGATVDEFEILTTLDVRYIREGYWNSIPCKERVSPSTGEVFYKVSLGNPAGAFKGSGHDWLVAPCYEVGCVKNGAHHRVYGEGDEPIHTGDCFERDDYEVHLVRYGSAPWELSINCDGLPVGSTGSFLSDVAWLNSEARRLNENSFASCQDGEYGKWRS